MQQSVAAWQQECQAARQPHAASYASHSCCCVKRAHAASCILLPPGCRCAWLNHSSNPHEFIDLVHQHPNIRLWFRCAQGLVVLREHKVHGAQGRGSVCSRQEGLVPGHLCMQAPGLPNTMPEPCSTPPPPSLIVSAPAVAPRPAACLPAAATSTSATTMQTASRLWAVPPLC